MIQYSLPPKVSTTQELGKQETHSWEVCPGVVSYWGEGTSHEQLGGLLGGQFLWIYHLPVQENAGRWAGREKPEKSKEQAPSAARRWIAYHPLTILQRSL